jgi:hypothetical protein
MNACQHTGDQERSALVADALRHESCIRLQVRGESMLPSVWPGDAVEIQKYPVNRIQPGDIVLATRAGRLFLHRFVRHCDPGGFILCGDSNPKADPVYPAGAFLGKVVPGQTITQSLSPRWSRALGFFLCYSAIARRLALRLHSRWSTQAERVNQLEPVSRGNA